MDHVALLGPWTLHIATIELYMCINDHSYCPKHAWQLQRVGCYGPCSVARAVDHPHCHHRTLHVH